MTQPSTAGSFAIDGEFTIYRAAELCEGLKSALADTVAGSAFELDLGRVTEMDSAGVQLLMAARKSAALQQRELHLVDPSPAVLEVFDTLDLRAHFGVASTTAAP